MYKLNNELFKFADVDQAIAVSSIGVDLFPDHHYRLSTERSDIPARALDTPYSADGGLCIPLKPDNGPMIFPYNPTVDGIVSFPVTLRLQLNTAKSSPVAIPTGINDLQCFFVVQNMPWGVNTQPLLRPHNWLHPDARENSLPGGVANQETTVSYKLFKNFDEFNLHNMHTAQFSTHLAGHSRVVYSPNNAPIEKTFIQRPDQSTSFYSLVVNGNKAALTLHWLLNEQDYENIYIQINELVRKKQIKTLKDLQRLKLGGMELIKFDTDETPRLIAEVNKAATNNSAKGKERQLSNNNGALPDPSNQVVTYDGYGIANPNLLPYGLADLNQYKLIKESFETFGLDLTPILADGNCFYYCLAHTVNETAENLRQLAANLASIQFQSMGEYELDLYLTELKSTHQSYTINNIEDYINLVRKTLYADQFTIGLLGKFYHQPIYVFEPNSSEFGFRCKQPYLPEQTPNLDLKEPLFVLHVPGDHFHLLKPLPGYSTTDILDFLKGTIMMMDLVETKKQDSSSLIHPRGGVVSSSSVKDTNSRFSSKDDLQIQANGNLETRKTIDVHLPDGNRHQELTELGKTKVLISSTNTNRSLLQQQLPFKEVYMSEKPKNNHQAAVTSNLPGIHSNDTSPDDEEYATPRSNSSSRRSSSASSNEGSREVSSDRSPGRSQVDEATSSTQAYHVLSPVSTRAAITPIMSTGNSSPSTPRSEILPEVQVGTMVNTFKVLHVKADNGTSSSDFVKSLNGLTPNQLNQFSQELATYIFPGSTIPRNESAMLFLNNLNSTLSEQVTKSINEASSKRVIELQRNAKTSGR